MIATTSEPTTTPVIAKKRDKVMNCYRCNQPGHKAVACPSVGERCCYNWGVSGHMAKNCPSPKPRPGPSKKQVVDEENNFVKVVEIGGIKLNALIDSGCKVSTIQSRFADQVGNSEVTNTVLVGFGGKKVSVDKVVKSCVKLDEIAVPVKHNVVPN